VFFHLRRFGRSFRSGGGGPLFGPRHRRTLVHYWGWGAWVSPPVLGLVPPTGILGGGGELLALNSVHPLEPWARVPDAGRGRAPGGHGTCAPPRRRPRAPPAGAPLPEFDRKVEKHQVVVVVGDPQTPLPPSSAGGGRTIPSPPSCPSYRTLPAPPRGLDFYLHSCWCCF